MLLGLQIKGDHVTEGAVMRDLQKRIEMSVGFKGVVKKVRGIWIIELKTIFIFGGLYEKLVYAWLYPLLIKARFKREGFKGTLSFLKKDQIIRGLLDGSGRSI